MKNITFLSLLILLGLYSCGGSKKAVEKTAKKPPKKTVKVDIDETGTKDNNTQKDLDYETVKYISRFQKIAKREMKEYGIPVSITLAQGILESQSGQSRLAKEGNNHFGIKCHKDWKGKTILHDDNKAQECFRKYDDPEQSYKDHSRFLAHRKRYAFLFRLPKTDYEAWARGLKKAGYATDPTYPEKLIYIIEKYGLSKMDKEVLKNMSVKVEEDEEEEPGNKKKKFIYEVQEGETLFTISRKFNIPVKDIQRINNLNEFDIYEGQILVLTENEDGNNTGDESITEDNTPVQQESTPAETTEPKTESTPATGTGHYSLHTVKQSETLFSISKKYHVSMDDLKEANGLTGNDISVGTILKIPMDKVVETPKEEKTTAGTSTTPKENKETKEEKAVYHIVQPGETLYRIYVKYGVPVEKLRKLNHLKGNYIKVGQKIRVK